MIRKVREYIDRHGLFQDGDRVIAGVSGGPDSMALLRVLHRLKDELGIVLTVAHLNHGLRGEQADEEAQWVKDQAAGLGLPFFLKKVDVGALSRRIGLSVEDTARRERYAFFFQLLSDLPADKIALGHQFHDQAETVLLHFLRGAGLRGLRGILPVRDRVLVRPLLPVKRNEITAYLESERAGYREDASNRSSLYLRNRVRHDLIPCMKRYNPRIEDGLYGMAETLRVENDFLEEQTADVLRKWEIDLNAGEVHLDPNAFCHLHEALQRRVVKAVLESRSGSRNGIARTHVDAVMRLIRDGHAGQRLSLPFLTGVRRQYDKIIFKKQPRRLPEDGKTVQQSVQAGLSFEDRQPAPFSYPVAGGDAEIVIEETGDRLRFTLTGKRLRDFKAPTIARIDYDQIAFPMTVRNMRPGDRFRPLGMDGTKKLKDYFIDRKVPRELRRKIPLLTDMHAVLWIAGMDVSETVKVTESTRRFLKIEII